MFSGGRASLAQEMDFFCEAEISGELCAVTEEAKLAAGWSVNPSKL